VHSYPPQFCSEISGMLILADFSANFPIFQFFIEQLIFIVRKRLIYEKASIFDGKYDAIKIKQFA